MNERYSFRLIRDLFAHKDAIFGELKRASAVSHGVGSGHRPRAISTDESNRRANMEERQRAIANRSRASSPAPTPRSATHRRDRSVGPEVTRFPIQTSPTEARRSTRQSLEVPGSLQGSPVVNSIDTTVAGASNRDSLTLSNLNGTNGTPVAGSDSPSSAATVTPTSAVTDPLEKRNSLGRSTATTGRFPRKPAGGLARQSLVGAKRDSMSSLHESLESGPGAEYAGSPTVESARPKGVELVDRPLDLD